MPVYNCEKHLPEAIESILKQEFTDFEFLIIDDGSTDSSVKTIQNFPDPRIRLFINERKGIVSQLNFAIQKSRCDLLARMDADDISLPTRLSIQYNYLLNNPDTDVVGSFYDIIDMNLNFICTKRLPVKHHEIDFMMPILISVCHSSILFRKSILKITGDYNSDYETVEDHKLFLDLIESGRRFYNIPESLLKVRIPHYGYFPDKAVKQNELSYKLGLKYLKNKQSKSINNKQRFETYYQLGLLEYYRGSMNLAKNNFINALKCKPVNLFFLLRYLIPSMLGQSIMTKLRRKGILTKISTWVSRYIGIDLNIIKKKY